MSGSADTLRHVNLVPNRWYTMLFMPSAISVLLILVGLVLILRASRRPEPNRAGVRRGLMLASTGLGLLYAASTPLVATLIARSLERKTPFMKLADAPVTDAIVVLGGGQQAYMPETGEPYVFNHHAGDRLEQGIRAFLAGKAPLLAVGGGSFAMAGAPTCAEYARDVARARGVPEDRIVLGGEARYTRDESEDLATRLREHGVRRVLLVTSATHMPRAALEYRQRGLEVVSLPCDFDTRGTEDPFRPTMLLPRGEALAQTESGLKEWLGLIAFRLFARP